MSEAKLIVNFCNFINDIIKLVNKTQLKDAKRV